MNKTKLLQLCVAVLCVTGFFSCHTQQARTELNMNTDWAFFRGDTVGGERVDMNDANWIPTALPHIMQLEKKHCGGDIIYDGVGWYRRYFKVPESYKGKRVALEFEGVMTNCEVFVNGQEVARNSGGYVGFNADISDKLKWNGENNVLAVRVSAVYDSLTPPAKPQARLDFYYYSGIYRDVKMVVSDPLHITNALDKGLKNGSGIFVTYPSVSKEQAEVLVKTNLYNGRPEGESTTLRTILKDANGKEVAKEETTLEVASMTDNTIEQKLSVANPNLWHPYAPYLYILESQLLVDGTVIDSQTDEIGIRTIKYTAEDGFFINGEKMYLIGANRHQSYPHVGDAASNSMQEREVIDMKRGGYNAVRAAHYPHDPAFLKACDKHGLLAIECVPGWQYFNSDPVFTQRLEEVTRGMIRRDRNRPSIIMWETALNETHYPLSVVEQIFKAAHEEYPGNQMYTSGDYLSHEDTYPYYDIFYKQVSGYPKDGSVMSNYLEDQLTLKPLFTREWGDGVGEKPRVRLDENTYEQYRQCRGRYKQLNGEGYFDWCMLDANPHMGGHFLWSYNDYARGAEEETMFCGVVDVNRYPKQSYYMMQSMRSNAISQAGLYDGPMIFIGSDNASAKLPTSTTEIPVYSNCDAVELYRNGKLIERKTREGEKEAYKWTVAKGGSPCFVFDAKGYEAGELKAIGFIGDKEVVSHAVRTPEAADHIEVYIPEHGITPVADGSDMIPVYFKICDKNGTLVNTSDAEITIQVKGEGALIGDNIRRVGINPQKVEGGIGFAFVRCGKKAGTIEIEASADGLKSGKNSIKTMPFQGTYVEDGSHTSFTGNEEDGVVVKPTRWDKQILAREQAPIESVVASSSQAGFEVAQVADGDDFSWWIAGEDKFPQVVTVTLQEKTPIVASRVRFQKDSSSYTHRVETSVDGVTWEPFYERECTGWEFKPMRLNKEIKYFRVIIDKASDGRAGLAEISFYK